jgi:hypothetical protein
MGFERKHNAGSSLHTRLEVEGEMNGTVWRFLLLVYRSVWLEQGARLEGTHGVEAGGLGALLL